MISASKERFDLIIMMGSTHFTNFRLGYLVLHCLRSALVQLQVGFKFTSRGPRGSRKLSTQHVQRF
jgi:hypothetical protein